MILKAEQQLQKKQHQETTHDIKSNVKNINMEDLRTEFIQRMIEVQIEGLEDISERDDSYIVTAASHRRSRANSNVKICGPCSKPVARSDIHHKCIISDDSECVVRVEVMDHRDTAETRFAHTRYPDDMHSLNSTPSSSFSSTKDMLLVHQDLSVQRPHSLRSSSSILEERIQNLRKSLTSDSLTAIDRNAKWDTLSRLEAAKARREQVLAKKNSPVLVDPAEHAKKSY